LTISYMFSTNLYLTSYNLLFASLKSRLLFKPALKPLSIEYRYSFADANASYRV